MLGRSTSVRFSTVIVVVVSLVLGPSVRASAQRAEGEDVAGQLLRRGVALAEAGDHDRAIEWFQRARALVPNDRIDVNLADSLMQVGRWADAERLLVRLDRERAVHPLIAELARERLALLRSRTGTVEVRVFPLPANTLVMIDERPHGMARAAVELRVGTGHHRIALVTYDGEVLARANIDVPRPDRYVVELSPVLPLDASDASDPPPIVAPPRSDEPRRSSSEGDPWPWIGAGLGVAAAAAVAITLGVVLSAPSPTEGTLPTVRLPGDAR